MNTLYVMLFLAVSLLLVTIYGIFDWIYFREKRRINKRLEGLSEPEVTGLEELSDVIRSDQLSQIPLMDRCLQKLKVATNLRLFIDQADVKMTVGQLLFLMFVVGEIGLFLGIKIGGLLATVVLYFVFSLIPLFYILGKRSQRMKLFSEQLPDALDMMTSALRAGHAFNKAIQLVANEAPDPIGMEFKKTFEEQNLGVPLGEALLNMTKRINNVDLRLFLTAVMIQRESGGNLTEILQKISGTIRSRFVLIGQIKSLTAQGKAAGIIVGLMPIAIGGVIAMINPDYVKILFTESAGRMMMLVSVILQVAGFFAIRKIVTIKMG